MGESRSCCGQKQRIGGRTLRPVVARGARARRPADVPKHCQPRRDLQERGHRRDEGRADSQCPHGAGDGWPGPGPGANATVRCGWRQRTHWFPCTPPGRFRSPGRGIVIEIVLPARPTSWLVTTTIPVVRTAAKSRRPSRLAVLVQFQGTVDRGGFSP